MKFTIECEMKDRWIPHLGNIGRSRMVSLYADGDGDFRPKFKWNKILSDEAQPIKDNNGNRTYDAG